MAGLVRGSDRAPLRSLLYVPGARPDRFAKALASGADAVIVDLEDAVAPGDKVAARQNAAAFVSAMGEHATIFVRTNPGDGQVGEEDLRVVAAAGRLAGVVLPKVESPELIRRVDEELTASQPAGGAQAAIIPLFETALGMYRAHQICAASPRVEYAGGIVAKAGDVVRNLGLRWSRGGTESRHLRSRVLLDVRAAGVRHPVTGVWVDVQDVAGLRAFAAESRAIGYTGFAVVHPSHVEVVHDVLRPGQDEIDTAHEVLAHYETWLRDGSGVATVDGAMIDRAMAQTYAEMLLASGEIDALPDSLSLREGAGR